MWQKKKSRLHFFLLPTSSGNLSFICNARTFERVYFIHGSGFFYFPPLFLFSLIFFFATTIAFYRPIRNGYLLRLVDFVILYELILYPLSV